MRIAAFLSLGLAAAAACGGRLAPLDDRGPTSPPIPDSVACWSDRLRLPEHAAVVPTMSVSTACAQTTGTPARPGSADEVSALLVGRWLTCATSPGFGDAQDVGIEFAGDGRWRRLQSDGHGALVSSPSSQRGWYGVVVDSRQLDLVIDGVDRPLSGLVSFPVDTSVLVYDSSDGTRVTLARTDAAANNGDDNLPSLTDGHCWLIGTWDATVPGVVPYEGLAISFDGLGRWVSGTSKTNFCTSNEIGGTYGLGQKLQMSFICGPATYNVAFDASCTTVTLTGGGACSDAFGSGTTGTTLTKRP